jgi:hypothetical protein
MSDVAAIKKISIGGPVWRLKRCAWSFDATGAREIVFPYRGLAHSAMFEIRAKRAVIELKSNLVILRDIPVYQIHRIEMLLAPLGLDFGRHHFIVHSRTGWLKFDWSNHSVSLKSSKIVVLTSGL